VRGTPSSRPASATTPQLLKNDCGARWPNGSARAVLIRRSARLFVVIPLLPGAAPRGRCAPIKRLEEGVPPPRRQKAHARRGAFRRRRQRQALRTGLTQRNLDGGRNDESIEAHSLAGCAEDVDSVPNGLKCAGRRDRVYRGCHGRAGSISAPTPDGRMQAMPRDMEGQGARRAGEF